MNKAETKAQRLLQIEVLLLDHPEGLSQSEIARRLNVNRSTIHRYLPDLTAHTPIFEEYGRLFIDRKSYLVNLKLNLYEALSLHLATRLMTNSIERHNPHAASLLRKLSQTIEKLSPQISEHMSLSADVADDPSRFQDPHYISILETLTLAWAEGREVRIWHRHTESDQVYQYQFSVYFIEPYAIGHSIHVIGLRTPPGELRTFNLARIERVELTNNIYKIPEDFDPTVLLKQAWGIWYTDQEPQEVKLRFSPRVSNRVLETRWHPSQKTQLEPEGSLLWRAMIAEPKEMVPWIRGWGADYEVLSPPTLRQKLINEISAMRDNYIQPQIDPHMEMWAKFSKGNENEWHPLLWHMLDTAAVVSLLWQDCLCESYKKTLSGKFQCSIEQMGKLLSFWISLHDIGKAGPEFQKKNPKRKQSLEKLGFEFPTSRFKVDGFHGTATTLILQRILSNEKQEFPRKFRIDLAITLGGHHGNFPSNQEINQKIIQDHHVGDKHWQQIQHTIYSKLRTFLDVQDIAYFPEGNAETNPFFMLLVGLTTTADWIASNELYFPYTNANIPINEYYEIAQRQAKAALETLGWYGWKSSGEPASFQEIFQEFTPNQIQQAVIDLAPGTQSPFLAIIEAPTGSGKTEAAFFIADTIIQRDKKAGIYIAMPTQATSNQMFTRTKDFLSHRYSQDEINLHLVHGAAFLSSKRSGYKPTGIYGNDESRNSNIQSHSWFLPRKRTLLAPFGVGTVDQTFLSVLKSRHFFLRLFGLSHKVLIFDEVHAYDVYMTEIFKTLLHWMRAVGTTVIILSATLPHETRLELLKAYSMAALPDEHIDFPRISIATENQIQVHHAGDLASREIHLEWIGQTEEEIVSRLKTYLSEGGCAAVLCNRVKRAQEVYEAVSHAFKDEKIEIILFHSRYPYLWRKQIEDQVLEKFGKELISRPQKAIVIATQVIEQSLDLDFDLMISDLAPVDLLIQRIGRLHRHEDSKTPPRRPQPLRKPVCIICAPDFLSSLPPDYGADKYIYEPYILSRTQLALMGRESIWLPRETDALIQKAYSNVKLENISDDLWEAMQSLRDEMIHNQIKSATNARNFLIPSTETTLLGNINTSLSDDNSSIARKVIAAPTREISPSVQIVCLVEESDGLHILGDENTIDLNTPLSVSQIKKCLQASATLNQRQVIHTLISEHEIPESFKSHAALRWHFPIIFEDRVFSTEKFSLHLDCLRGIQVIFN